MKRHVLHIGLEAPSVRIGGLTRYLEQLCLAQRDGLDTSVAWLDTEGVTSTWDVAPIARRAWLRGSWGFARVIRRSDADILDVHFAAHAFVALLSGSFRGRPFVLHFQGPWADESAWTGARPVAVWFKRAVERSVLRRADALVVLSDAFRQVAVSRYGVDPRRVHVIAPGFPAGLDVSREDARRALGWNHHERVALMVRRLVPRMGHEVALEALATLPDWRLVIAGDGPSREMLVERAIKHGVADRLDILGRVDDEMLALLYAAANVSLVPSLAHEGFGLVVLESIAAGTPVVASDLDGLADAARLSPHVTLVPPNDSASLARAWEMSSRPSGEVRAHAMTRPWSVVADEISALYEDVLNGTSRASRLVVYLDHTAQRSGGELALSRAMSGLSPSVTPHVILGSRGGFESVLREAQISFEVVPMGVTGEVARDDLGTRAVANVLATARYARRVRSRLVRLDPDVVHSNSLKALIYGTVASVGRAWPLVAHVRDRWAPPYLSARVRHVLRTLVRLRVDAVIANSASTAEQVPGRVDVIASPVADLFFAVGEPSPSTTLRIAVVGRLAPWKGQDFALRVVEGLPDSSAWHLTFIGDALFGETSYRDELREAVAASPVRERVTMAGAVVDVARALTDVDVVLLSSQSPEPFGNVVVEAMAAGRVVVVPNEGGVSEVVTPGVDGLVYDARDEGACRTALRTALEDESLRRTLGAAARRTALRFGVGAVARQLESLYDEVRGS